jgi:cytidine deaminase
MTTKTQLLDASINVLKNSYCPYSQFMVGAALLTTDDIIFSGCNVENVSFGLSMCAERIALFKAISEGYQKFDAIAIASNTDKPIFPCGACRQVLFEFSPRLKIFTNYDKKDYVLVDLLPYSFDSIN